MRIRGLSSDSGADDPRVLGARGLAIALLEISGMAGKRRHVEGKSYRPHGEAGEFQQDLSCLVDRR